MSEEWDRLMEAIGGDLGEWLEADEDPNCKHPEVVNFDGKFSTTSICKTCRCLVLG